MSNPNKFILIGPESSGKSSLFKHFKATGKFDALEEQSRIYLNKNGLSYSYYDLQKIAIQHIKLETQLSVPMLLDTDLITLQIWSQERYAVVSRLITKEIELYDKSRFYFLCKPDIPWEPDPMREHPNDRERLFELYRNLLETNNFTYIILEGNKSSRINKVEQVLSKYSI